MTDEIVDEEKQPEKQRQNGIKTGILLLTLAIIIFICAFGFGYFELAKVNVSLAQMVADLKSQMANTQNDMAALQKSVATLQQSAQKSATLATQQEQIMNEWRAAQKGDVNKWHIAEAQYLVNLANDHLQFTHNVTLAIALLQRADQVLQNLQDPNLLEIRKSLAADIASLQATPQIDMTSLYLHLTGLNAQLDQLPLPINPLKPDVNQMHSATLPTGLPWWKEGWERTWDALGKIVIVRNTGANALPLVLPDEKIFLYQNLHAQMESAMWGVLHRNAEVYQASLSASIAWIQQYFVQDAPETKSMLQHLQELRKINIQPPALNLSTTLQLFDRLSATGTAQ